MRSTGADEPTLPAHSSAGTRHLPALDGVRGLAAIAVVWYHIDLIVGYRRFEGGFLGVDVFFVLSGCLITMLLVGEHDRFDGITLRAFYARRGLRLLPALAVVTVLVLALGVWRSEAVGTSPVRTVAAVALYVANWALAVDPGSLGWLGHAWSLSIEEQYYLLWPPVLALLLRRGARPARVVTGLAVVAVAAAAYRYLGTRAGWGVGIYWHTPARADAVVLGSAVGIVLARNREWLAWATRPVVGVVAALGVAATFAYTGADSGWLPRGGSSAVALAAALLVAYAAQPASTGPVRRLLELAPLRLAGRTSYGLYLYHLPIVFAVHRVRWHGGHHHRQAFVAVVLTVLATWLSFVAVERPALRLKRRFERVDVVPPVAGAPA